MDHFDFQCAMWDLTMLSKGTVSIKPYYILLFM